MVLLTDSSVINNFIAFTESLLDAPKKERICIGTICANCVFGTYKNVKYATCLLDTSYGTCEVSCEVGNGCSAGCKS